VLRAQVGLSERFYRKVYPARFEADAAAFDFSDTNFLQDYMQEAAKLTRAKGVRPEHVFLGRAEMGLYQTLHRLGARVHTSRLVREYLRSATNG
jgi:hypothetical protein